MTAKEFETLTTNISVCADVDTDRHITQVMSKLYTIKLGNFHSNPSDPDYELWRTATAEYSDITFNEYVHDIAAELCHISELPYKLENKLYLLSLIPNDFVQEHETAIGEFLGLSLTDYYAFLRRYMDNTEIIEESHFGDTIADALVAVNSLFHRGMLSCISARNIVLSLLVYPFTCSRLELLLGGKITGRRWNK